MTGIQKLAAATLAATGIGLALAQDNSMSFFLTSAGPGNGADLGGLEGADAHCQALAEAAGAGDRSWRAYLSTDTVSARDRIGDGPWYNANGAMIASDVDDLHDDANIDKETALDENGNVIKGSGDTPNRHDILTGTRLDGTAFDDGEDHTCSNWTSSSSDGSAHVGHHDRLSRGNPGSPWNDAHPSRGCSQSDLQGTGGDGLFYCFATD